jgi:hypothetical protein
MCTAVNRDCRLVEFLPFQVEAIALDDRHRMIIGGVHWNEAYFAQRHRYALTTHGEDPGAGAEAIDQQMSRGLGGCDHVGSRGWDAKLD